MQTAPSRGTAPFVFAVGRAACLELHDVLRRRTLLSLHDVELDPLALGERLEPLCLDRGVVHEAVLLAVLGRDETKALRVDRKSTRLNSSHGYISYAVFCLKKKKKLKYEEIPQDILIGNILNSLYTPPRPQLPLLRFAKSPNKTRPSAMQQENKLSQHGPPV